MHYPSFDQMGISAGALNRLIAIDSSQNCFPSLHAALTLLAVLSLIHIFYLPSAPGVGDDVIPAVPVLASGTHLECPGGVSDA